MPGLDAPFQILLVGFLKVWDAILDANSTKVELGIGRVFQKLDSWPPGATLDSTGQNSANVSKRKAAIHQETSSCDQMSPHRFLPSLSYRIQRST